MTAREELNEDLRWAVPVNRTYMSHSYRASRVCQIRGATEETTAAYMGTYVRIAEEGVRSRRSRAKSRDRWRAIDGRTQNLEVIEDFRRKITQ